MNKFKLILSVLLLFACHWPGWAQGRAFTVQTSSMPTEAEAKAELARLAAAGLNGHLVKANVPGKGTRYRVRFGRYSSQEEAKQHAEQALKRGAINEYIVTLYETPTTSSQEVAKVDKPKTAKSEREVALNTSKPTEPKETAKSEPRTTPKTEPKTELVKESSKESGKEASKDESNKRQQTAKTKNTNEPAKSAAAEIKPAANTTQPGLATTPAASEAKPNETSKPVEPKAEPKAEPVTAATKPTEPDKVPPAPRIATPPIADALGELDITNHNWKIVRKSAATDKNLRAIYFVDSMTGWAAGDTGVALRTTDGGKTWKPLLSGAAANINQIQFVDWNNGWMLGEITRRDDEEPETILLSTTNGGRTWTKKALPNVLSIFFSDPQHGWAVGKNATILRTEDGGQEWKPYGDLEKMIGLPVESSNYNFGFRDIYFLDTQRGWLIGNFYGRAKSHIGGLFVTNDGGATWKRLPLTVQTQYSSGRFTPGLFHSVRFSDANNGSVTGEMQDGEGRFFFALHTQDGGKSWHQFRTPSRAAHSTQFLSPATGWTAAAAPREGGADAVVYDTTLMRTDNGGASWQYDFVARGSRIRGVYFLSPSKGWAVGDRGMILRYEDKSRVN